MEPDLPPAFIYYNPWPEEKRVKIVTENNKNQVYDLMRKKVLQTHAGTAELKLSPFEALVIEIRA